MENYIYFRKNLERNEAVSEGMYRARKNYAGFFLALKTEKEKSLV